MGILSSEKEPTPASSRRKSTGLNFGDLKPLNQKSSTSTKNFGGYRDSGAQSPKSKNANSMDSDAEDDDDDKRKDTEAEDDRDDTGKGFLSPEDAMRQGELAEGVRKIKVRTHVTAHFIFYC